MPDNSLIIIGASARAAACAAQRAGYAPYWLDRFGDTDLRARFPGQVASNYPRDLPTLLRTAPAAPFIYTGALEHHPDILQALSEQRPLLGNASAVCRQTQDPFRLYRTLREHALPCPEARIEAPEQTAPTAREPWLVKPLRGGGGMGIRRYAGEALAEGHYLQQYLPGESYAAVFLAGAGYCRLLGVTLQLVGAPAFCAEPFSYCGSIGPLAQDDADTEQWRQIGAALSRALGLQGLFGVDAIKRQGRIYPVELNPRYTASVEVLELALGHHLLQQHCDACNGKPAPPPQGRAQGMFGKAIVFAPDDLSFRPRTVPGCIGADLPAPDTRIKRGQPVQTLLTSGTAVNAIKRRLEQAAGRILTGRAGFC